MQKINELQLAKELIRFPTVTPVDAGVMKFLEKKLKKLGFKTKILEFKEKGFKPVKNLYARLGTKEPGKISRKIDAVGVLLILLKQAGDRLFLIDSHNRLT